MDICVYVHAIKVIRCEYNNRGVGASEIRQTWGGGGAYPKRLKTPEIGFSTYTKQRRDDAQVIHPFGPRSDTTNRKTKREGKRTNKY